MTLGNLISSFVPCIFICLKQSTLPRSTLLRTDPFEAIAVVIVSSQKSAPVAVTLISYVTGDTVAQGLLALPAIVGQLTQIFIGSAISALVNKYVSSDRIGELCKHGELYPGAVYCKVIVYAFSPFP